MRTQYRKRLAVTAAVIGLAASSLAIPGSAAARGTGDDAATRTGVRPLALPGLHDATYHVTLVTGDRVTLTSSGQGRYSVVATPNPGATPAVAVTARSGSRGNAAAVSATPFAASALVASGMLDRNLFDLRWLATHGDNGSGAVIPLTVQFSGKLSAAALTGKAAALGGVTLVAAHPETATVDLKVSAAHAAPFWAALSGQSATPAGASPHLTGGAVHVWPTGDRSADAHPSAAQPLNRVTETITGTRGSVFGCNGYLTLLCVEPSTLALYGVDGNGIDNVYQPSGITCVDADPCTTYRATYSVPSGIYSATGFAFFLAGSQDQYVDLIDPQVTVAGDTGFALNVDAATQFHVGTPRPSQAFTATQNDERTSVDGTGIANAIDSVTPNYWAVPSAPVTAGTFHLTTDWVLGQPQLTMSVTAPQRLALDPSYFVYRTAATYGNLGAVRFTGRKKVGLVDAGAGRPEDFAGVDARGKFVLMHEDDRVWCQDGSLAIVLDSQLNDAIRAGAVGVLFDPMSPGYARGYCSAVIPEWYGVSDPVDMPFATIPVDQGDALLKLLAKGPVTVDASGYDGNSPYIYTPSLYQEGKVPASLRTTLTDAQLTTVTDAYHSSGPSSADEFWGTWRSNEFFGGASIYEGIVTPGTITEYRGPAAPDVVTQWWLTSGQLNQIRWDMVTRPGGRATENWAAAPETPGSYAISPDILRNQPGKYDGYPNPLAYCSFCRQGNTLYPVMYLSAGADPALEDGAYGFPADSIQLYHDGQELQQTPFAGDLVSYRLPAGAARYRLVARDNATTTTWDFTSSAPSTDRTPTGTACPGAFLGASDPCAPDPFLFLRYDAGTDLTNTVTGGDHELRVTAYHQAPGPVAVRSLAVWTSVDGGKNWTKATVAGGHDGAYTVRYRTPTAPAANAKLSIRAQATDADGNDVTQIVIDAVALAAR